MSERGDDLFDGDESDDGDGDSGSALSTTQKDSKSTDKRVSDLQSARDKETARANKAEARIEALERALKGAGAEASKSLASAGGDVTGGYVLDMARMFAVQQNPKLGEYGLSASDLTGSTPAEIAQSAAALVARFEKIETQARNKVLAANGLAPEVDAGVPPAPSRDFSKMSAEDFKKVMDAALSGRRG